MWEDPIVAEVHRTREKLAAKHNYDIAAFFADVRRRQAALGPRLVRPKKEPNQAPNVNIGSPGSTGRNDQCAGPNS